MVYGLQFTFFLLTLISCPRLCEIWMFLVHMHVLVQVGGGVCLSGHVFVIRIVLVTPSLFIAVLLEPWSLRLLAPLCYCFTHWFECFVPC